MKVCPAQQHLFSLPLPPSTPPSPHPVAFRVFAATGQLGITHIVPFSLWEAKRSTQTVVSWPIVSMGK